MTQPAARILVVDDEPTICHNCVKILIKSGHDVSYALDGTEALAMMADAPFDVVVTDLKMSRMGGMEVLRRIGQSDSDTLVIVITGYSTVSSAVEVMKLGAFDYLPKPFTPRELRAVVDQAMDTLMHRRQRKKLEQAGSPRGPVVHKLVGDSTRIQKVVQMIAKVAPTDATVLIHGESGTGKELVARAVHANSQRSERVFYAVDCGTLSGNLLESELFGHTKGAFTGAHQEKKGLFRRAHGGSVFLDEIGNIDLDVQGRLLRFLESREFTPLGQSAPCKVDVRLIFATNQNLEEMVADGRFREDFYYRIFVYPIMLPPLRHRREDILPIAYHFIDLYNRQMGLRIEGLEADAAQRLAAHAWPGNVRQLRNLIERAMIQCDTTRIGLKDLALDTGFAELDALLSHVPRTNEELKAAKKEIRRKAVEQIEKRFILHALSESGWNVTRAAEKVGIQRSNFQSLMRKHGIKRPDAGSDKPSTAS